MQNDFFNFKNLSICIVVLTIIAVVVAAFNQNRNQNPNKETFNNYFIKNTQQDIEPELIYDNSVVSPIYNIQGVEEDRLLDKISSYYYLQ